MANSRYPLGREGILDGTIAWSTGVFKLLMVRPLGSYNVAHKFVSSLTAAGVTIHATSPALASKTSTGGVANAADVTFTAPATHASLHALVLIQSSAPAGGADVAASAQRVVAWLDSGTSGIPITPNGEDVTIVFDSAGIFSI